MTSKIFALLTIFLIIALSCSLENIFVGGLDISSADCGFGFQNGSYLYFRDPISFEYVEQIPSSNTTYGDWVFFQEAGSNERFGFYSTGVNVTVNNYFDGNILELNCVGAGTVKVQVNTRTAPITISGSTAIFDQLNRIAVATVTSSVIMQLNWNPTTVDPTPPPGGGGGGTDEPTTQPTIQPSTYPTSNPVSEPFKANNIDLGKIASNTTVIVPLTFSYSGSNVYLKSLTLPEPFNSWYVPNSNFSSTVYLLQTSGQNTGTVNLVFNVGNLTQASYSGTFTVTAVDAFNTLRTSTASISATNIDAPDSKGIIQIILGNPLYMAIIAAVIIGLAVIGYFASKKR